MQAHQLVERDIVRVPDRVIAAQLHLAREDRLRRLLLDVLRHVDQHRAGPAGLRDVKGLLHDPRNVVHVGHEVVVFHHLRGHGEHIRLLERAFADHVLRHLAGDRDQRHGIEKRIRDAGHEIGRAGAARRHANAGAARGARVPFGRENAALLVARQQRADLRRARERLVHVHRRAARISENGIDAFPLQAGDEDVRAAHHFAALGRSLGRGFG